jgi:hypothetical protein
MNMKSMMFAAVLACAAGLGIGLSGPVQADPGCRSDCYDIRYECHAGCEPWNSACKAACELNYQDCLASCG